MRAYYARIHMIAQKIERLRASYKDEHGLKESLERVRRLLDPAIADIELKFDELEAQSELLNVLRNCDAHIKLVRKTRDELHRDSKVWEELTETWQAQSVDEPSDEMHRLVQETYRFLARNFPQSQAWGSTY